MEEAEQMRGEEMGLTVKQRQAIMNELRGKYLWRWGQALPSGGGTIAECFRSGPATV
jgi:hypothetical protein